MASIKINLGDKVMVLSYNDTDLEIDADDILRIDYSNLVGEMLTFPVIMNRVGLFRGEANDRVRSKKLEADVYRARLSESYRKSLSKSHTDASGVRKSKPPTIQELEDAITLDEGYQLKMKELFRVERNYEYMDSLYWACKSKDDKLKAFGHIIVPEEFEKDLIDSTINGIKIKGFDKPFKTNSPTRHK